MLRNLKANGLPPLLCLCLAGVGVGGVGGADDRVGGDAAVNVQVFLRRPRLDHPELLLRTVPAHAVVSQAPHLHK